MVSTLHGIAELVALRFVDFLAEGTFVCVLGALALRLAPRQNAATRFALWFSALIAIVALPWIGGASPHAGIAATANRHAAINLPESWAVYFLAIWGVVAVWFGLRIVRAVWHLNVLRRNCVPVDAAELDPILRKTLERHGANRGIALCISDQVRVPTAVGLLKPAVLVPSWVMRDLSAAELNQVLLHELAHFRRWDDWTNLAQQIVKALFFFHPAVWWIDKQVAVEREMACDDAVLAETRSPRAYAECLAHLAEKSFVNRSIALAQAALGKIRQTSARVAQILDNNRPAPTSNSWRAAMSLVIALAIACGVFYSRAPRLIAFGNSARPTMSEIAALPARSMPESAPPPAVRVVQAKLKLNKQTLARRTQHAEPAVTVQAKSAESQEESYIHLTGSEASTVPFTETFWVVVQRDGTNPPGLQVYEIQMWRVTVLRTVFVAPSHQVPRNET